MSFITSIWLEVPLSQMKIESNPRQGQISELPAENR